MALGASSPTTFYPCELECPSPDALCVFRREREALSEATPSLRRRAAQARNFRGSPPPAPKLRRDAASPKRLPLFEPRPLGDIGARLSSQNLSQKHLCCPLSLREKELEGPVPQAVILILALMGSREWDSSRSRRPSTRPRPGASWCFISWEPSPNLSVP